MRFPSVSRTARAGAPRRPWPLLLLLAAVGCGAPSGTGPSAEGQPDRETLLAADPGGIPVEAFFRDPERSEFRISPDGRHLAWLQPWENRPNLFVRDLATEEAPRRLTGFTDQGLDRFFWTGLERIAFLRDPDGGEAERLFCVDLEGRLRDVTSFDDVQVQIVDRLPARPDALIVAMNRRHPALFEPFLLDLTSGRAELLAENRSLREPMTWWVADHDGVLRVAISVTDGVLANVLYREGPDDEFRKVLTTDWTEHMHPLFFDADNRNVYAASNLGRDKTAIVRYDLAAGRELGVVYAHPEVDVYDAGWSENRDRLTWVGYAHDRWRMVWMDTAAARLMRRVRGELGRGVELKVASIDAAEERFVLRTYSDRDLGAWYLYDRPTDRLMKLAEVNGDLPSAAMAPMRPVRFPARDGLVLHGYLTLPTDRAPRALPLVVLPHGGPRTRDYWGFRPEVQLLANRGYAVLQVNYRGSVGYGRAFANAGFGEWGGAMQDDLADGVAWLADSGVVDPERVAIAGFSFGGYCALAGLAFGEDTYACGISYAGLADLHRYVDSIPDRWGAYRDMLYQMVGHPSRDSARLAARSPIRHLDGIRAPLLVAHGARDPRVPVHEARALVRGLRALDRPVHYLEMPDEGHAFAREENRLAYHRLAIGFLGHYLPPDAPPLAAFAP
jgi:dipeptidyl aminopeptidase/acylaminoacyl peptidase